MKIVSAAFLAAAVIFFARAQAQQVTPAEQKIAAAKQEIAADPKKPEAYNSLALALLSRAKETATPGYDREAAEAVGAGLKLDPQNFQLRKTHVAVLLDEKE